MTDSEPRWEDPDAAVQIEDDNPEALAGVEADAPEDFPYEGESSDAGVENLPVEGA